MASKRERQQVILEVIGRQAIGTQEGLRHALAGRGVDVTQATLSRDLRELGLVRAPGDHGPRYVLPERLAADDTPSLEFLLPELFASIDGVGELIVLRTLASGAQPIAEAIDAEEWPEVLGTIGGENTVLLICRGPEAREAVMDRLRELARE
jgi:transcriptional regulator of arginine metabolism